MNLPPHFRPLRPLRPPPAYHSLPPPVPHHATPNSILPLNLQPSHHYEAPSSSFSTSATGAAAASSCASDLPTALSTLTSLLRLTRTTLNSLSTLLPTPSNPSASLVPCPFNPNHLVPASSLFSHYISCLSSSTPLSADDLLHSLCYPHTLHSSTITPLTLPLENLNSAELCFSLENFLNFSNFFYSDCPGPVTVNNCGNSASYSPPMLTLPGFLCAECANLTCTSGYTDLSGFRVESFRLLPSEIWAVGEEMNGWHDFPASYSYRLLRAILSLDKSDLLCLPKWVIMNSPKYSIIIDLAMRDHIVLLFKLCFKAIVREATKFASSLFTGNGKEEFGGDKGKFDCPVLSSVMRWLGFQLSVLYGELNGKFFTINVLKQCVLDSSLNSSVFPAVGKTMEFPELKGVYGKLEEPVGKIEGDEQKFVENGKGVHNNAISISQVAAAVAALHERSWLERKIKALRDSPSLTAYQRMVEHEHISKRASDERQKRSDYRPVIEHDGLLWQQTHNLEQNRMKTREELLAEERDYRRRRMSYRGKKTKRSTTQVMRDIIDEYMEEIKQASNAARGAEEVESGASVHNSSLDVVKSEKNHSTFRASRVDSDGYGDQLQSLDHESMDFEEKYLGDNKHRYDSQQSHGRLENDRSIRRSRHDRRDYSRSPHHHRHSESDRSIKKARHDRKEYSRSPDQRRSGSHLQADRSSQGNRDDPERTKENFLRSSYRSHNMSYRQKSHCREGNRHNSELRDKHARKRHGDSKSASSPVEFEDGYTPSESHDSYGENA